MECEICEIIRKFKITSNYKGYLLMIDAIIIYLNNYNKFIKITKDVYPFLSQKYSMSFYSVERDIRTIVEKCWYNDKIMVENLLGYKTNKCPSNGVFLESIAHYIIINNFNEKRLLK